MRNFEDLTIKRRSIRKYDARKVDEAVLRHIVNVARKAPSGGNAQPWRYMFVTDAERKEKLRENKAIKKESSWAYDAPVITVCCTNPEVYKAKASKWDDSPEDKALRDLTIGTAYLDLAANDVDLKSCWIGWIDEKVFKDVLHIPDFYRIPYILTLGYSDHKPKERGRKSVDEIILDTSGLGQQEITEYE